MISDYWFTAGSIISWTDLMVTDPWSEPGYVQCSSKSIVVRKSYGAKLLVGKLSTSTYAYAIDEDHSNAITFSGSMQVLTSSDPTRLIKTA